MKRDEAKRDIDELNEFYAGLAKQSSDSRRRKPSRLLAGLKRLPKKIQNSFALTTPVKRAIQDKRLREKLRRRKIKEVSPIWRPWIKTGLFLLIIFTLLAVVWLGSSLYKRLTREDTSSSSDIAPAKVFVPQKLPDGFSVGSDSKTVQNGAVVYTVYDKSGQPITVSQQTRPPGFEVSEEAQKSGFDTPLGRGYIMVTQDKFAGYILADETMVLFSCSKDVDPKNLVLLMRSFEP